MSFLKKKENSKEEEWLKSEGKLTVDLYETEKDIVVQTAIAGVEVEDLDISIENDLLEIKGEREKPEEEATNYFIQECYWGKFQRKIILPLEVDNSKIKASMKMGILTITLPKVKTSKKKKKKISLKK